MNKDDRVYDPRPPAVVTEDDVENLMPALVNKVDAVHQVVEDVKKSKGGHSIEDNDAKEDYEDDKMYEGDETNLKHHENQGDKDSNEAAETKNEEILESPRDGSLRFEGPKNDRQKAVVEAFRHAWTGYKTYAWGHDHLRPISKGAQNWFGLGLTLVDSLDTMLVMNLVDEFEEAKEWVSSSLSFSINKVGNFFIAK